MSGLLRATETSSRAGLVKALERAAAGGETTIAETLLGALSDRYPTGSTDGAVRALNRAVHSRKWETAAYLADFLADTARPRATEGGGALACEHIEQEVMRCLADCRREHRETADPDEPFLLTDAIEDTCLTRGVGFAISVAIVNCAARGVPPTDRLECARKSIAREDEYGGGNDAITFEHVDSDLPPDAYGGEDNPRLYFSLAEPDRSAAELRGKEDPVVPSGKIGLRLSFPPEVAGIYEVETPGTREGLARAVAAKYGDLLPGSGASGYDLADLDLERVVPDRGANAGAPLYAVGVVS